MRKSFLLAMAMTAMMVASASACKLSGAYISGTFNESGDFVVASAMTPSGEAIEKAAGHVVSNVEFADNVAMSASDRSQTLYLVADVDMEENWMSVTNYTTCAKTAASHVMSVQTAGASGCSAKAANASGCSSKSADAAVASAGGCSAKAANASSCSSKKADAAVASAEGCSAKAANASSCSSKKADAAVASAEGCSAKAANASSCSSKKADAATASAKDGCCGSCGSKGADAATASAEGCCASKAATASAEGCSKAAGASGCSSKKADGAAASAEGCTKAASSECASKCSKAAMAKYAHHYNYKVTGLGCTKSAAKVQTVIESLEMKDIAANVDHENGQVVVGSNEELDANVIVKAMAAAGYPAELLEEEAPATM